MPRPKRPRCISSRPMAKGFKPRGIRETGENILTLEEFESVRLIDYEGLDQSGVGGATGPVGPHPCLGRGTEAIDRCLASGGQPAH